MKKVNAFIQKVAPHLGMRYNKFGLAELIKQILNLAYKKGKLGRDEYEGRKIHEQILEKFFSNMETDLGAIQRSQKLFAHMIEDTPLINFLLSHGYPDLESRRRDDDDEYSSKNDVIVLDTVNYLNGLSKLIAKKPIYAPFRKIISEYTQLSWFKQMEQLVANSKKYSKYSIKTTLSISLDRDYYKDQKSYKISSEQFVLNFVSGSTSVPMFNRMGGSINIRKTKRKFTIDDINVEQEASTLHYRDWQRLILKALNNDAKLLVPLKKEQKIIMNFELIINADTGSTHALVKVNNGRTKKLSYVFVKDSKVHGGGDFNWVNGIKNTGHNPIKNTDSLDRLNSKKNEHLFVGSRKFIYSYRNEFRNLFSCLDELVLMAAIVNFYHAHKGKWVMPKMKPMESMLTDIKEGLNPLFFQKGAGVSIPNDFLLDETTTGFLITGANTGGKTGYTNMYAINQMLAQAGLPVFASSATMAIKDGIFCHYVESDDIGVNLSRYQSELHRLHQIIEEMTKYSVVLFDEPFSGTGVESGTHQAYEVLKTFTKVKCACIMNTHLHPLVGIVGNNGTSSISQIHFLLPNPENPLPTDYKVQPGGITASYGELIAQVEKVDHKSMMKTLKKRKVVKSIR